MTRKPKSQAMPTTEAVAHSVGIEPRTLYRWIDTGEFREPNSIEHGGKRIFLWSPRDIERLKKHVAKNRQQWGSLRDVLFNWQPPTLPTYEFGGTLPVNEFQPSDEILSIDELAARLKVRKSTIYELSRQRGRIRASRLPGREPLPSRRVGKYLRFSWQEVIGWLNRQAERGKV